MSQQQRDAINKMTGEFPLDVGGNAIEQLRCSTDDDGPTLPGRCHHNHWESGRVPTLDITTATRRRTRLLWFHGGWYTMGSPRAGVALSSHVARRWVPGSFRLTTGSLPAPISRGVAGRRAAFVPCSTAASVAGSRYRGESAGGGLVVSRSPRSPRRGFREAAAAVLFSPWTDLKLSGASMTSKVGIDPSLSRKTCAPCRRLCGRCRPSRSGDQSDLRRPQAYRRSSSRPGPTRSCSMIRCAWRRLLLPPTCQ